MGVAAVEPDLVNARLLLYACAEFIHGGKTRADDIGRNDGDRGARSVLEYKCTNEKRIANANIRTRGVNLDAHRRRNFN